MVRVPLSLGSQFMGGQTPWPLCLELLTLDLSVELLFPGLALTSETVKGWRAIGLSAALGLTVLFFAVVGTFSLAGASPQPIAGVLAFSAVALRCLVIEGLLIEGHTIEEKHTSTLVRFSGVLDFGASNDRPNRTGQIAR